MEQIKPTIIASEGGAGYFPENTAYAVEQSLSQKVDGCELDLHLCADKIFVAHHDYCLNVDLCRDQRGNWLTNKKLIIKNLSYDALKNYNVGAVKSGSKIATRYQNRLNIDQAKIACLDDIKQAYINYPNAEFWFEAKTNPYDLELTTDTATYVKHLVSAIQNTNIKIVLIAFDWQLLIDAKKHLPNLETGFLSIDFSWLSGIKSTDKFPENKSRWFANFNPLKYGESFPKAIAAAGGTYWSPYFRDVNHDLVAEAHDLGLKVSSWGADTEQEIETVLATGIDSLTTAYVDRAKLLI